MKLKLDYTKWCELLFGCFAAGTALIIAWLLVRSL